MQAKGATLMTADPAVDPTATPGSGISREQVELAVLGDQDASRAIVEALHRSVIATIHRFLGRPFAGEVEDIAQEVFLKFFHALHRYDPTRGARLSTWMFSIVKNHCFDLTKRRGIETRSLGGKDGGIDRSIEPSDARGYEPPNTALRSELGQQIHNALQRLSPDHRLVFVLREYEGLGYRAVAEVLDINEGTVKSRLHRAKLELRQRLERYVAATA